MTVPPLTLLATALLACSGDDSTTDGPSDVDTDATSHTGDTVVAGDTDTDTTDTAETGHTGAPETGDTGTPLDCAAVPAPPLSVTRLTGPPASEDFAFDDAGKIISHQQTFLVKSDFPPGAVDPWAPTQGGPGGPASIRMLSTGDVVYHDVDTSTLYRVEPSGSSVDIYTGFGYAGGIEVHPTDLVYVVDLVGLHRIDPYTGDHDLDFQSASWSSPNGVTLSADHGTLYVSARDGIYTISVDGTGAPTGPETLWADPPVGANELLGMGVDACDNVYVTGSAGGVSTLWRYPAGGTTAPEVLLERPGGWLSNLQWGSGVGGWDDHMLYVVDRNTTNPGYDEVDVGVPEKPR